MAPKPTAAPERASEAPRRLALETGVALLAFTGLALYVTWPLARDLGGRIFGLPGDSTGTVSLLWQFAEHEGFHLVGTTHIDLTGAPFGWDFPNALNIQWAFVFLPATLATDVIGEIAAYNLIVLSGLALSGASMYLLTRYLGAHPLVAGWAGLVYTIFPWHIEKAQGHAGFVHLEGFPLLILAALAWYRRPVLSRALLPAAASLLLWTTAGYFGLLGAIALAVTLTVISVFHVRLLGWRRGLSRYALAGACSLGAALLVFVLSALGETSEGVAPERGVGELSTYGARYWEFVLPSYENPLFGDDVGSYLFSHLHGSNFSETSLYVGWLTLMLAIGWLVAAIVGRRSIPSEHVVLTVAMVALVIVALAFSLPSPLPGTEIQTPSRLLWELVPQFRVPSRFVVLVMTGLVCLAALGLESLRRRLVSVPAGRQLAGPLSVVVCAAAIAISFMELSIDRQPSTTDVDETPAYVRTLARERDGIVAEYPLLRADQGTNSNYLFWQRLHERPLVNGAQLGTFADAVGQSLVNPATPATAPALATLGVSTIVMRPSAFVLTGSVAPPQDLGRGYRLVRRFSEESVWRVVAKPAPAVAAFDIGFSHAETPSPRETARWMVDSEAEVDVFAPLEGQYVARFKLASYARPRLIRIAGRNTFRLVTVLNPQTFTVPVLLPRGRSFLRLSSRPGPESVPDGRKVTVYISNWDFVGAPRPRGRTLEAYPR